MSMLTPPRPSRKSLPERRSANTMVLVLMLASALALMAFMDVQIIDDEY